MAQPQEKGRPLNIVKSDFALKLAEQWVNNMSKAEDDVPQTEVEGRPSRLGLGAKVPRQTKIGTLNDPLEKRLYAKLVSRNRNSTDESNLAASKKNDGCNDDDSDDDELESRAKAFDKKRSTNPVAPPVQRKKKKS